MSYKVFLVEDEIAAREGIRDNVDWRSVGFEFCGEAPDGEIALPLIEAAQPDVLITDIKMPFMDGLQLTKIVREHLPWVKVIILSGYDEFRYAQTAVKLGVTEYLLKPINVPDLQSALVKVARGLDQEKSEREYLKRLRSQVEDNLSLLREKFLLRLVLGGESPLAAIEESEQLGVNLLARCYLVLLVEVSSGNNAQPLDYATWQKAERLVAGLIGAQADVLLTKRDVEDLVLILKGESAEEIEEEGAFLAELIRKEVEDKLGCRVAAACGSSQRRLGDLHRSFAEALGRVRAREELPISGEMKKLDQAALLSYLESGSPDVFDAFFDRTVRPLAEPAMRSNLLKHYLVVDLVLTAAQFVSNLGGSVERVLPEVQRGVDQLADLKSIEQMRAITYQVYEAALAFRDSQAANDRVGIIQQAKGYINQHFADADLSLNEVAAQVNFSPNHFSAVFSGETGQTFRDYLANVRVDQAKRLLRSTRLKCAEVATQCGYNDPHYFSILFRRHTGLTPQQYRAGKGGTGRLGTGSLDTGRLPGGQAEIGAKTEGE